MEKLLFRLIHRFPRLFAIIGIKSIQPDVPDDRDDVMGQEEPRFDWSIINQNGDWTKDFQSIDWEVQKYMDCTGHAIKNIIEILAYHNFGEKWHLSEAYINKMAGTSKYYGNSLKTVLESVRKNGWVTDEEWPAANRWKAVPATVIEKGKQNLKLYDFGYDLTGAGKKSLDTGCMYSPLYVGGAAWARRNGLYYSFGRPNHAFTLIRNSIKRLVGDSYNPHIKQLETKYTIVWPRRIFLGRKEKSFDKSWIDYLQDERNFEYVQRVDKINGGQGQTYKIFKYGYKELTEQEKLEIGIKELANTKKLTGISEADFRRFLK